MTNTAALQRWGGTNKRFVNGLTAGLLAVALIWVFVAGSKADPRAAHALKTPHSVIAVTTGTEPLILGSVWQQTLLKINPKLGSAVGGTALICRAAVPGCLVVWEHYGRATVWSGPPPMLVVESSDELGHRMRQVVASNDFLELNGDMVFPFVVKNFPRRGRTVGISGTDLFEGKPGGATLWVPNPSPGHFPIWKAESDTPCHRAGDLVGILREFRHPHGAERIPGSTEDLLRLFVQKPRGSAADWTAEKLQVEDATGNSWVVTPESNLLQTTAQQGELHITCPSLELSDEEVFNVRLTLGRVQNLPAAETATVHDLPLPKAGVLLTERRAATIQGRTVEITHEIGSGASHNLGWSGGSTDLAVWLRNPAADRVFRIRPPGASVWDSPSFRAITGCYCVSVPDWLAGKRVSLQVGLTRLRTLEFRVRPRTVRK